MLTDNKNIFQILPSMIGLFSGIPIWVLSDLNSMYGLIIIVSLALVGFFLGTFLYKRLLAELALQQEQHEKQGKIEFDRIKLYVESFEKLFIDVLPIVSNQIDMSKQHTEQEIGNLSERLFRGA